MDAFAEGAGAFAVDDSDFEDAFFSAFVEVLGEKGADLVRSKGVEIELGADRVLDGIV